MDAVSVDLFFWILLLCILSAFDRLHFTKAGITPPRMIVVRNTIISTVPFTICTSFCSASVSSFEPMVRISAKATDPRMSPANHTIPS